MKYLLLVWFGIWRKPGRTLLIFLQVAVAFALFGMLEGLKAGIDRAVTEVRADLLLVFSQMGMGDDLPVAALTYIRTVPGVRVAIPVDLVRGTYQKPSQEAFMVALSPERDWTAAFTFDIPTSALPAFQSSRSAALASDGIAARYGWKVGDRVPVETTLMQRDGSTVWTFDIVGIFHDTDLNGGSEKLLIHYDYLDEARITHKGTVNHINVAIQDPAMAVPIADAIDMHFVNSGNETKTQSLRELAQQNLAAIGDLNFLVRSVVAAVLAALLFATTTMMVHSLRERTPELAVLKTLGFTDGTVFALILSEAVIIYVAAALCGLGVALLIFPLASKVVPGLSMPPNVAVLGVALALLAGLLSASFPAIRAARIEIATALAHR